MRNTGSGLASLLVVMAITAGCGDESVSRVAEGTTTTTAPASTTSADVAATSVPSAITTIAPVVSTTIAPGPPTVIPRSGRPVDAASFVAPNEILQGATELPNGDLLVSLVGGHGAESQCSATIYRVNSETGERMLFSPGAAAAVSPDAQNVVFANVGESFAQGNDAICDVSRVTVRPLAGGPDLVFDELRMAGDTGRESVVAGGFIWAADSAKFVAYVGAYQSEGSQGVFDTTTREFVFPSISDALDSELTAAAPESGPHQWGMYLGPWLSDGTLVATPFDHVGGNSDGAENKPRRFALDVSGVIDIGGEITNDELLRAIRSWELAG